MSFLWVILAAIIGLIIVVIGTSHDAKKREEKQDSFLKEEESNGVVLSNKTNIENGIIGIDKKRKMLIYIDDKSTPSISKKEFPFSDIISCELIEDGKTIYKKSAMRTIGGAMVGGVVAGGVGSIIGGLSGGSTEQKKINSIDIKITLRDIDTPNFRFRFFEYKGSRVFINAVIKSAEEWKDRISAIIDMTERDNK